ncbi:flagellar basal-body MS-ring/collar protein FliF [Paracoccus sediminicola]|uniref:flagellar basal-body MS-ring/collar protein FliF n=1 Tax=Paracoccus sediminicola TaxID=3017783 RepID=UPI0022F0A437|nr:flagellar basal-body MS-ring/collar protein FliF [Paracoccus sediminicola]WBU56725.1 flagellar basal-body MS-ring/collar protein FliF [Paracoccus sediminicola]
MQELHEFWKMRTSRQRMAILGGFAASLILVLAFVALAGRIPMALLYSGLDDQQAGPVVAQLEQGNIAYELRGGSIWVDERQRDRLRMELAAQNLPRQGGAGYEILDQMSGFSTTSQMFDAAYWRAKEGELARTILSIPSVRSARVHLTAPQARGYRDRQPGAASVTVVTDGTPLTPAQADAMRFLISSAVPQLTPSAVSVIDSVRGVIQPPGEQASTDRATRMKENVERILAPHVGSGNAIVEVSVDLVTESEQLTERRFDPTQRAMISQETEELTDESSMAGATAVTAASNLPERMNQEGDQQSSQRAETRQRANYEVGSVTRQVERRPGAIRRLSVAVLVNGVAQEGADGETQIVARSEAELDEMRELVAAAVGFDEDRGDEITVKSMAFIAGTKAGTQVERSHGLLDRLALDSLARLGLVGLFAIMALGLTMRALRGRGAAREPARLDTSSPPSGDGSAAALPDLSPVQNPESSDMPMISMAAADFDFDSPGGSTTEPVERLKSLMKERREETVRLLNGWIGEDERSAT